MSARLLAIDIGSSSLRTALFTESGTRIMPSTAARKYSVRYTPDGGAELSPDELLRAARACVNKTRRFQKKPIIAACGSGFWHSLLGLDHKRRPITPIFTWADSRSTTDAVQLRRELSEREIQEQTGCMLRAPFWPAKLRWLRRTDGALFRRVSFWVSPASWIFEQLFGADITSHSMASGTGLYDLQKSEWHAGLCKLSRIRPAQLGPLQDVCLTSDGLSLFAAIGDGAAGNFGSGADDDGKVAINIGTSAAARLLVAKTAKTKLSAGLFRYVADDSRFVIGGAISNAGNLHQWSLRELSVTEGPLDRSAAANDTLTVLPFWVQERAPTWPENLRGTISGLTASTTATEILRAATTSTFYRLADILDRLPTRVRAEIVVSGGILHSPSSLAILADSLGRDVRIRRELESSLRGAAVYALKNLGHEASRLKPGKIIRHRPALALAHRARRKQQRALEKRLG